MAIYTTFSLKIKIGLVCPYYIKKNNFLMKKL